MPGIFGVYDRNRVNNLPNLLERMALSMSHDNEMRIDRFSAKDTPMFLGRVSLGILNQVPQPVYNPTSGCRLIFHGELYDEHGAGSDPEYVLAQYLEQGDRCVNELNGVFHFIIYDRQLNQLKLFNDKFGLQPLYYAVSSDGIVFGGEVKALLMDNRINKTPDYHSFADFFHFGQVLGEKTLFKDIKLLAPASILTFNLKDCHTVLQPYWHLDTLFVKKGDYNPKTNPEEVVSLLIKSIKTQGKDKKLLGLSLSGGLDSRGVLAGLGKDSAGIHTYTLGLPGCADQKLAERMARAARTDHEFIVLNQDYIKDFDNMANGMIHLSDGLYHPHESTEMLALDYFKRAKFKVLLRGHGGEIAKAALAYPVMVTPRMMACANGSELLSTILTTTNLGIKDIDIRKLFSPSLCDTILEGPSQSLTKSCGEISHILAPADVCIYYYIKEHIRRQVVASLEIFRSQVEIRMPYIETEYIKKLMELPLEERSEGEIHFKLIERTMPELLKIPNSNTGAPLDAGPLLLFLTDKFNSLMKRLSIKGFRHYTEFQKWHREGFKESSRKIIFSEQARDRNIYQIEYLKKIFDLHMSGRKDYGHLLGTIVGIELWFNNFVD